jgi:hypothetical protein
MSNNNTNGGLGLTTIVFLVFLILKLTDNIDWSWWWVFSPFWIPVVLVISIFVITIFTSLLYIGFTGKNLDNFFKKK